MSGVPDRDLRGTSGADITEDIGEEPTSQARGTSNGCRYENCWDGPGEASEPASDPLKDAGVVLGLQSPLSPTTKEPTSRALLGLSWQSPQRHRWLWRHLASPAPPPASAGGSGLFDRGSTLRGL